RIHKQANCQGKDSQVCKTEARSPERPNEEKQADHAIGNGKSDTGLGHQSHDYTHDREEDEVRTNRDSKGSRCSDVSLDNPHRLSRPEQEHKITNEPFHAGWMPHNVPD